MEKDGKEQPRTESLSKWITIGEGGRAEVQGREGTSS